MCYTIYIKGKSEKAVKIKRFKGKKRGGKEIFINEVCLIELREYHHITL